ncbi:MAG: selenium cofactor biosynthesis protein YqeC [Dehalococcoidia bacterium]|nr:selenium cofactor biosynthesis protein YqeC [Dehalococcoidia bacterium]
MWRDVYPYTAAQIIGSFGRASGRVLELGSFSGGISFELAGRYSEMQLVIADSNAAYLAWLEQQIDSRGLPSRIKIVSSALDALPFADGSFDLIILRGAFFFIMDAPSILSEIHRVLAYGGLAFVGGGYGRGIPQADIDAIADESRLLNDRLGRRRVAVTDLKALVATRNLSDVVHITEEGGVWLEMRKPAPVAEHHAGGLAEALGVVVGDVISVVGGGGKTSLMFTLAEELVRAGKKVITTTTTRIMPPEAHQSPSLAVDEDENRLIAKIGSELARYPHVTAGRCVEAVKLKGLHSETVDRLAGLALADYIINEADGAARMPVKAPNATEPVVPQSTTLVVAVVGLDGLCRLLGRDTAFRVEFITSLTGLLEGEEITPQVITTLMTDKHGIIQNTPPGARIVPFLNKADLAAENTVAALAGGILARCHPQIGRVVSGAVLSQNKTLRVFLPLARE